MQANLQEMQANMWPMWVSIRAKWIFNRKAIKMGP